MKSQVIKNRNIPCEELRQGHRIHVKPWGLLIFLLGLGVAMALYGGYLSGFGMGIVTLSAFAIAIMPDRILAAFTPEYLILFNRDEKDECAIVYYEDIVSWCYEYHSSNDLLVVELVDGSSQNCDMFSRRSVLPLMNRYCPNKEIKRKHRNDRT